MLGRHDAVRGTLSTGCNEGVVSDNIGLAALSMHLTEEVQGQLPPPRLLTGADQAAVCDDVALTASPDLHHAAQPASGNRLQCQHHPQHDCCSS